MFTVCSDTMLNGHAAAVWYFNNLCKQILIIYNRLPSFFKLKHSSNYQIFSLVVVIKNLVPSLTSSSWIAPRTSLGKEGGEKMIKQKE